MSVPKLIIGWSIAIAVFLAVVLAAIWAFLAILEGLSSESFRDTSLAAGIVTIVTAILVPFISKRQDRKAAVQAQLREKKLPVYEEMVGFIYSIVTATVVGKPLTKEEIQEKTLNISKQLTIWGANDILIAFAEFKKSGDTTEAESVKILERVADLLLAVRRDLGYSNKGVDRKTVLRQFVLDIDDHIG